MRRVACLVLLSVLTCPGASFADTKPGDDAPATRPAMPIGVIDLDQVADAVGWTAEIRHDMETVRESVKLEVASFSKAIADRIRRHKQSLIKSAGLSKEQAEDLMGNVNLDKLPLPKDDRERLITILQQGQQYVQQADQAGEATLRERRTEILVQYRKALAPIVRQVAEKKGMMMVVTRQDTIIFHAASIDITHAVTDAVRTHPPKIVYPAMPRLNFPEIKAGEEE